LPTAVIVRLEYAKGCKLHGLFINRFEFGCPI
jgi:hypothetical protein